jgi:hypothetical protein
VRGRLRAALCRQICNRCARRFHARRAAFALASQQRRPGGISPEQFNAGQAWTRLVHRHAAIMGYSLNIRTPSFIMVGGGATCLAEPEQKEIVAVRRQWFDCYNTLMGAARDHGLRVSIVTYGVCVENWPVGALSREDFGMLRIGLNALGKMV